MAPVWWKVQLPSTNISRFKVQRQNATSRNENTVHTFTDLSNLVNHAKQWQGKNQFITGVYIIQNYIPGGGGFLITWEKKEKNEKLDI